MSATDQPPSSEHRPASKKKVARRFGGGFLIISIGLHLLLGAGATYYVVQTITAKRKLTFKGGPPSPNPQQRAVEHKVEMAKKQNAMSAPAPTKRIATVGMSKVTLPDMPVMSNFSGNSQSKMNGAGGTGIDAVSSVEMMKQAAGNGGGGGVVPFFGLRNPTGGALAGTLYDLKQSKDGKPTNMAGDLSGTGSVNKDVDWPLVKVYNEEMKRFVKAGFGEGLLQKYFHAPNQLFTTQIFIPRMSAAKGPEEFGVADKIQPKRWVVHYTGKVVAPVSGRYHFVGYADDMLLVRFGSRLVLDGSLFDISGWVTKDVYNYDPLKKNERPTKRANGATLAVGEPMQVTAGTSYNLEIAIGECPGGSFTAVILLLKDGEDYKKDSRGNPILPIFKLAPSTNPAPANNAPVVAADTPWSVWRVDKGGGGGSPLDVLKKKLQ